VKNLRDIFRLEYLQRSAVFLFLLFLPTQLGKHFFLPFSYISGVRIDYLAPTLFVTDILFFVLVFLYRENVRLRMLNKTTMLFVLLFFAHAMLSAHQILSLYKLFKLIEIYCVFCIFSSVKIPKKILFIPLFIGAGLELILSVLHLYKGASLQGVFYLLGERHITLSMAGIAKATLMGAEFLRPYATFSHPNSMGGFYALIFFFSFFFFSKESMTKRTVMLFMSAAIVIMSFSKLALGTLVLLFSIHTLFYARTTCRLCVISRLLCLGAVFLMIALAQTDSQSLYKRWELFQHSLDIVKSNFFFGVGLGHYFFLESQIPFRYSFFSLQPVHNIFMLFLSEVGIIIFTLISVPVVFFIRRNMKEKAFMFCILVVFLTGFFDHYWLTLQQNMLVVGVVFGLLTNTYFLQRDTSL